jgi:twitching motility protein PilT
MPDIVPILKQAVQQGASDVLLCPGEPPVFKTSGVIQRAAGAAPLSPEESKSVIYSLLTEEQRARFESSSELDCSFALAGASRFRANVFVDKGGVAAALRVVPDRIPTPQELGLPPAVTGLTGLPRGLVLVTGPTGSGKTTTLASLVESINQSASKHILTIEDPIEFVFAGKRSVVNQREVGTHTQSFAAALRESLRQNPDVIVIGELRDLETIALALTAAETGHLCFATLHTKDAPSTVDRIVDVFPAAQQPQVRVQLADVLAAVVCQALLPKTGGGRICAREIMTMTPAIASLIHEDKTAQMRDAIESGASRGMMSLDQHLAMLVRTRQVDIENALAAAREPGDLKAHLA